MPANTCCAESMRVVEFQVTPGLGLVVCVLCHNRKWTVEGRDVSPDMALRIARYLDGTGPSPNLTARRSVGRPGDRLAGARTGWKTAR